MTIRKNNMQHAIGAWKSRPPIYCECGERLKVTTVKVPEENRTWTKRCCPVCDG